MNGLTIGKLAKASGLRTETLRYYERLGLIQAEGRKANGYRVFLPDSVMRLQFIHRAKLLNFTLEEIKDLFLVRGSPQSNCEQIYQRLQIKITEIDGKMDELATFKQELQSIAKKCPRGSAPLVDCSLMDFLDKPSTCCVEKPSVKNKTRKKKGFGKLSILLMTFFLFPLTAHAKPIPYTDGWMIMQENNTRENLFHAVYGLTPDFSAGISSEWFKDKGYWLHSAQLNYLAARQNLPDAQMNLFFMSGAGAALKNDVAHPAGWVGMLADYESRRWLVSYDNNFTYAHTIEASFAQKVKVGIAPYIGEYEDVHTWLMIQFEHYPDTNHEFVVTPMVRLFKDNYLGEIGYSSDHKILFNWNITI
jgi:DNA-binding transcriptional MerR regulator